jgi:hypothetical protein
MISLTHSQVIMKKRTLLRRVGLFSTFLLLVIANAGCTKDQAAVRSAVTNYSKPAHWLALPSNPVKSVDVFYVYPTTFRKVDPAEPNYCAIDNATMVQGAAGAFRNQATAFETTGNVYAPYYRQADARYTLALPENQRREVLKKVPVVDVTAAFDYYIRHYNKGRPFILAGHSQGANVLLFVLSEYMAANPKVYQRMIAAYITGYPVTESFLAANKHLKFAQGPDDTGVIISYNTQSPKVPKGTNIIMADAVGLVINPINWKRDTTLAAASQSLGSYMPEGITGKYKKVLNFADARIDLTQGVLVCSSVDDGAMFKLFSAMGLGIYHGFDIQFYYYNLRENAERRANKFLRR